MDLLSNYLYIQNTQVTHQFKFNSGKGKEKYGKWMYGHIVHVISLDALQMTQDKSFMTEFDRKATCAPSFLSL